MLYFYLIKGLYQTLVKSDWSKLIITLIKHETNIGHRDF